MLKQLIELIKAMKESPAVALIAACLTIIVLLVLAGYKDMTTTQHEQTANFQRLEAKFDLVDDKVDILTIQVQGGALNDSTVIREVLRLGQLWGDMDLRVRRLEDER